MSKVASAQSYPSRPVRLIVGFAPGGPLDIISRLMGQWLSERLGQPFVIENRAGAGSNLAATAVVNAPPDGYTLLQVSISNAFNATLYNNLNFNIIRDIAPIAGIVRVPAVLEVNPTVAVKTVPELIAYVKANPGKLNMASGGRGSVNHLYGELFKKMAGVDLTQVHYRGSGPAMSDLISGQVQVTFDPLVSSIEHIKAGLVRPLAVTSATRQELFPDIPTMGEFVPGYEATGWQGLGAPKGTPAEIIERLNKEVNAGLVDEKFRARLAGLAVTPFPRSPSEFGAYIVEETERWGKVIRANNINAD